MAAVEWGGRALLSTLLACFLFLSSVPFGLRIVSSRVLYRTRVWERVYLCGIIETEIVFDEWHLIGDNHVTP